MTKLEANRIEQAEDALLTIDLSRQILCCRYQGKELETFSISSGTNGPGELENSGCTPRGWHEVADVIGLDNDINSVFVGREWTGETYSSSLASQYPNRDWILTRIIRLKGLEPGRNFGGGVDTFSRYIYIHGTPDEEEMGLPKSHGCIRMRNIDVIKLARWIKSGVKVFVDAHSPILREFMPS